MLFRLLQVMVNSETPLSYLMHVLFLLTNILCLIDFKYGSFSYSHETQTGLVDLLQPAASESETA
jgi:hypothetical protein